jgi:hypothetical protein
MVDKLAQAGYLVLLPNFFGARPVRDIRLARPSLNCLLRDSSIKPSPSGRLILDDTAMNFLGLVLATYFLYGS